MTATSLRTSRVRSWSPGRLFALVAEPDNWLHLLWGAASIGLGATQADTR